MENATDQAADGRAAPEPDDGAGPVTCFVRYELDLGKLAEFEAYARIWIALVERHGGRHFGYFLPTAPPKAPRASSPAVGRAGPEDVALAMFSFPSAEAYRRYRSETADDPQARIAEEILRESRCFERYEGTFVREIARGAPR